MLDLRLERNGFPDDVRHFLLSPPEASPAEEHRPQQEDGPEAREETQDQAREDQIQDVVRVSRGDLGFPRVAAAEARLGALLQKPRPLLTCTICQCFG